MGALTDLWKSERGLLAVIIIVAATVLAGLERMTIADWQTFVMGIFITYAAGKTATGVVQILKGGGRDGVDDALVQVATTEAAQPATSPASEVKP